MNGLINELSQKSCRPLEKGTPPLSSEEAKNLLQQLNSDWELVHNPPELHRSFKFKNYYQTIAFVNALAWIAHQDDHHPDLEVHYSQCVVNYTTHAIDGLSENDFICAAKIDRLVI